jgi:Heterokaryon incompatibility protein (HET)
MDDVKLYQPSTTTHDQYVALSYCWGTKPFLRTLLGNIEAHKDKLDMLKLPQTFKDAIMITRRLGFRYVWIDALCIIQDSADDKMKEIGTMEKIYSEASLTIAIVSHSSVIDGFLNPRSPLAVKLPYRCPDGEIGSVLVSPQKTVDMWQEPLYTRAWCLQENLLSPRMLLYTDTEVVWQCQLNPMKRPDTVHVSYQDDNPELGSSPFRRLPANLDNHNVAKIQGMSLEDKPKSCITSQFDEVNYRHWRFVVGGYTRRKLSMPSDRLPALAGVAQKFKEAWGDEYYAGLVSRITLIKYLFLHVHPQAIFAPNTCLTKNADSLTVEATIHSIPSMATNRSTRIPICLGKIPGTNLVVG